ncbi:MAG: 2-oxoacid:acceptor oxidoreductase family protein [Acidihalobacter sp.]|uniref:2-oxoacid:acceptor oxidoreductase family protein n=1 Tax=Acidihalobacter sp. TaxID=1872108 RepID=UPI00307FA77D
MIEVRIHGRGGQGNVAASYLLAGTAIDQGWHALAFPAFGAERRGAPVAAFVRMDRSPFSRRDQIAHPDYLIVQDEALLHDAATLAGLKPGGGVLVNSPRTPTELGLDVKAYSLPANALAEKHLGRPVPNTALLAAFITLTGLLPLEALSHELGQRFKGAVLDKNRTLIAAAAEAVEADIWNQEVAHAAGA